MQPLRFRVSTFSMTMVALRAMARSDKTEQKIFTTKPTLLAVEIASLLFTSRYAGLKSVQIGVAKQCRWAASVLAALSRASTNTSCRASIVRVATSLAEVRK